MLFSSCHTSKGFAQGAYSERAYHGSLVFRRASRITRRLCSGGSKLGSLVNTRIVQSFAKQRLFSIACLERCWSNIGQADACIIDLSIAIKRDVGCHASYSVVSDFTLKFKVRSSTPLSWCRNANLGEDFIGTERCFETAISEEFIDGNDALDCGTNSDPIAYDWIGYHTCSIKQNRIALADERRTVKCHFTSQRTNVQDPIRFLDVLQAINAIDVD